MQRPQPPFLIGIVNETIANVVNIEKLKSSEPGFAVEIAQLICLRLALNCTFILANLSYGDYENGNWTGMLGAIAQEHYNTSLPIFSDHNYRLGHFNFGVTAIRRPIQFVTRRPGATPPPFLQVFIRPFSWHIWVVTITLIILLALVIVNSKSQSTLYQRDHKIVNALVVCVNISAYLVRKGPRIHQLTQSAKIALSTWGVATLFLVASYTGGLQPSMFKTDLRLPFTDLDSLISCLRVKNCQMIVNPQDQWFLKIITVKSMKYYEFDEVLRQNPVIQVNSEAEAFELMTAKNVDSFLVAPPGSMDKLLVDMDETKKCAIVMVKTHYDVSYFPILATAKSIRSKIDRQLHLLEEAGLLMEIIGKYKSYAECNEKLEISKTTASPIPARMALGALVLLSIGCVFGCLAFFWEVLFLLLQRRRI